MRKPLILICIVSFLRVVLLFQIRNSQDQKVTWYGRVVAFALASHCARHAKGCQGLFSLNPSTSQVRRNVSQLCLSILDLKLSLINSSVRSKMFAALNSGTCTELILMKGFYKAILGSASMAPYLLLRLTKFVRVTTEYSYRNVRCSDLYFCSLHHMYHGWL